MMRPGQEPME